MKNKLLLTFVVWMTMYSAIAQDKQEEKKDDIYSLSLEELLNVPISSASKKEETLFDAPLSSYTITKADIDRSGVTSIMEALRLAPGVVVREVTNGIYDIHIRGFDNVTRYQVAQKANLGTLIMLDNRPVYNPINGTTYWETIPVDLNDIERIEVVRGPSAALFGPNAVTGVINIVTRRAAGQGVNLVTNVQGGASGTQIFNASVGRQVGKWNINLTGNFQNRGKYDNLYYSVEQQKFVTPNNLVQFVDPSTNTPIYLGDSYVKNLPHANTSLDHFGVNAAIMYTIDEKSKIDLTLGTSQVEVQKIFSYGIRDTYFNTNRTNGSYANLAVSIKDFKLRTSINSNTENSNVGNQNLGIVSLVQKYDYVLSDAVAEYDLKFSGKYKITPGVSYQGINFDDTKYHDNVSTIGLFNGSPSLHNFSGYVRTDLEFNRCRIIAALRTDKFEIPNKAYFNYELAMTYKITDSNLIRFAITRANSGSYVGITSQNLVIGGFQIFEGNKNLNLFTIDMQEIGFRSKLSKESQLDIDIFRQQANDYAVISGTSYINSTIVPTQYGLTASLNYAINEKFHIRPFITIQSTSTANTPAAWDAKHTNTPAFYGGYYLNFRPAAKFNINVNGYYFANQRQYDINDPTNTNPQGDIKGKFLVNCKASYTLLKGLNFFVNVRNSLNSRSREFYAADQLFIWLE